MKPLVIFGVMLIAIGIAGLLIDNISFTEKQVVVDAGPIKVTADQQRTIPIPSIAGVIADRCRRGHDLLRPPGERVMSAT